MDTEKLDACIANEEVIAQALDEYQAHRWGCYRPARLRALVPRFLDRLPHCPTCLERDYGYQRYGDSNWGHEYVVYCQGYHQGIPKGFPKMSSDLGSIAVSPDEFAVGKQKGVFRYPTPLDFMPDFIPEPDSVTEPTSPVPETIEKERSSQRLLNSLLRKGDEIVNEKDGSVLVPIPSGSFTMGNDNSDSERPPHSVRLPDYYIGKFEVTNEQFSRFVKESGYRSHGSWRDYACPGREQHPVVCMNWEDAVAYCKWAGLRLPSEAEWEKAARGKDGRVFPWGNEWDAEKCTCDANKGTGNPPTRPVGTLRSGASPYGVLDMAGNVWEWCSSAIYSYPYKADDGREGLTGRRYYCVRGGSWNHVTSKYLECSHREDRFSTYRLYNIGFRVAYSPRATGSAAVPSSMAPVSFSAPEPHQKRNIESSSLPPPIASARSGTEFRGLW